MSPNNRKKLLILRKKLDAIDNKLLNLLKIRANQVKKVLSLKEYKKEIIDRKRINLILKNVKTKSIKKGIDPRISNRIWKNMIYAFIEYEFRNFKKNKK
ncbi:chorismate mutase [Candidatus Pelagibacter sp.]|nr:chorismate mutase [Candidatus Pelagibacter sp.]